MAIKAVLALLQLFLLFSAGNRAKEKRAAEEASAAARVRPCDREQGMQRRAIEYKKYSLLLLNGSL